MFINYEWTLSLWTGENDDLLMEKVIRRPFIPYPGMFILNVAKTEPVEGWEVEKVTYDAKDSAFEFLLKDWRNDLKLEDLGDGLGTR